MNFDIKTEQLSDDSYVISLAGEVDLYTAPEFKQQLLEVLGQDAKSQGTIGPNLDDAFSSDKQQGFSEQTMADVIRGQIAYADPQGPMTPNLVRGSDADAVALYIAKCAGNPSCGVTAATSAPPPTT